MRIIVNDLFKNLDIQMKLKLLDYRVGTRYRVGKYYRVAAYFCKGNYQLFKYIHIKIIYINIKSKCCPILHSLQGCMKVLFVPHSHKHSMLLLPFLNLHFYHSFGYVIVAQCQYSLYFLMTNDYHQFSWAY